MDQSSTFLLPKPDFAKKNAMKGKRPVYLTPSGMTLLPREKQPPPMYGPKGSTVPPRFLPQQKNTEEKPPEKHFCEPCEMELQTLYDYRRHRSQHENCPIEGCSFKAHPSVMDKHVIELHNSGIFEKIKKISSPEDIAAWREERRKKFPTAANAEIRKLAQEQRQRRGERLDGNKSRFGRKGDRKRARNVEVTKDHREKIPKHNQHDSRNKRKDNGTNKKTVKEKKQISNEVKSNVSPNIPEETSPCGMRLFAGTSKMKDYQHEKEKKSKTNNVLLSMLGMYGSDDDDDDDEEEEEKETNESFSVKKEISEESNNNDKNQNEQKQTTEKNADICIQESFDIENLTKLENHIQSALSAKSSIVLEPIVQDFSNIEKDECNTKLNLTDLAADSNNEEKKTQDSSDEAPDEAPIQHSDSVTSPILTSITSTSKTSVDCQASLSKISKKENSKGSQKRIRKYGLDYRKMRLRKQNTMLEKLLEPDIRHERNVLLQCVRFVCQNNFFGIGASSNSKEDGEASSQP